MDTFLSNNFIYSYEQLLFIEDRYNEKELEFKGIQQQLASYRDRNQNVNSLLAQTKLHELQSEYDMAFNIYNELAKQLESQKIQVKEDTPVFTVIKPVSVPFEKAKPKRGIILLIWILVGSIIGIVGVFGKEFVKNFVDNWNNIKK